MARIKIDVYADQRDAAAALGALRGVGLNPGDVASAWRAGERETGVAVHEVSVADVGLVHFTGWLAEHALKAAETGRDVDLTVAFRSAGLDDKDITRAQEALAGGGGLIGVRARDSLSA